MNTITVYINLVKAAERVFFTGAIHPSKEAAERVVPGLTGYVATLPLELPEEALK